jgi:hypothetical protein
MLLYNRGCSRVPDWCGNWELTPTVKFEKSTTYRVLAQPVRVLSWHHFRVPDNPTASDPVRQFQEEPSETPLPSGVSRSWCPMPSIGGRSQPNQRAGKKAGKSEFRNSRCRNGRTSRQNDPCRDQAVEGLWNPSEVPAHTIEPIACESRDGSVVVTARQSANFPQPPSR